MKDNDQLQEEWTMRHQFCTGYPDFESEHICCSPNQEEADEINKKLNHETKN